MRGWIAIACVTAACHRGPRAQHRQLAEGVFTGCRLDLAGHVTCWRLGHGAYDALSGTIAGIDDATQICNALNDTCALHRNGTVSCWGIDYQSATPGRSQAATRPIRIAGLDHVAQVACGQSHVCAVRASGEVDCWGDNFHGQTGQPTSFEVPHPKRVDAIDDAVETSAGDFHTCVRHRDGRVSCFGAMSPVPDAPTDHHWIDGITDATALASGGDFVCALTRAGEVWCAGENSLGQLGGGDVAAHAGAVRVRGLTGAVQITASDIHACARTRDGAIWCWGAEFGHSILPQRNTGADYGPVRITGIDPIVDISVGDHEACAALADSSVWCWASRSGDDHGPNPPVERDL